MSIRWDIKLAIRYRKDLLASGWHYIIYFKLRSWTSGPFKTKKAALLDAMKQIKESME